MASIFGHPIAALALGQAFAKELRKPKFWILGVLCSIVPDADVIGKRFGIRYGDFWGHRGFTHSFFFAALFGTLIAYLFYKSKRPILALYFALCTASHSILDAMTTGGKGVAFFSPFENSRYFLPWRPIRVSPMSARKFLSHRGLEVLASEALWIGLPFVVLLILIYTIKQVRKSS